MSNTPSRRDRWGRKFWRGPHALSMAAAKQRRAVEAEIAERSKLDEPAPEADQ